MIRLSLDITGLANNANAITLSDISQYPKIYALILSSLQQNKDIVVIIKKQIVFQWIKNLATRYPQNTFAFETLDAHQALSQKWGVSLPDNVLNDEILESNLLQLDLEAQPGQDFTDVLLTHFYGQLFNSRSFPFTQLSQLFQAVDAERWRANRADPLLARTFHQRIERWKSRARSSEQRQIIEWFATDPTELHELLMQYRVLRSYPEIGETLLGEIFPVLNALKLQLEDLAIEGGRIPKVISQVTYHLNDRTPKSVEDLEALLDQVSGLLMVEYETLEKRLLAHPDWISNALLDRLEIKFETFSRRLSKRLEKLRGQIRPAKPQAPDVNWTTEQMLDWATQSYLPYQAWCSAQEEFDKELYKIGDQFSAWLMEHWNDIHANSKRMLFNILPKISAELSDQGHVHVILVVDNLGWSFSETLGDLFQEKGYYLTGAEPYLAMLPTETEISKKCLLSGAVGYSAIDDKTYKGILEKGWLPYADTATFRYISDIGKLGHVDALDAHVYVVNYLAVDKTLHNSADKIGMPHREHIRHLLEKLVENVADFAERHNLNDRIRIHVVSDHGSTQIPSDLQNDLDPAFFKQSGFDARSHRFLEVSDERFNGLADNLKIDCFFLPANDFLLPANVLCARGGQSLPIY